MPEVSYELKVEADEEMPVRMQVISYDGEGENLPAVSVHLELATADGSLAEDGSSGESAARDLDVVTNTVGKAYFVWQRPPGQSGEATSEIKATWQGSDPFVFIERFHPREDMELV
ncbi:MAG: hypothetical protein GEU75_16195 [Dehalococcoidia bacterium]|nr:hypothetical protein [Dehalococcoidia bacterium]